MTTSEHRRPAPLRPLAGAFLAGLTLLGVAAPATAALAAGGPSTATTSPPAPAAVRPAASGTIASVQGSVLEVQNPQSGQTTVNVTSKTEITQTVIVKLSAVKKGECITATGTKGAHSAVAATNVVVEPAVKGQCFSVLGGRVGGFGGGAGGGVFFRRPGAGTGSRPTVTPNRPVNFSTADGEVLSVSKSTIKLSGFSRTFSGTPVSRPANAKAPKPVLTKVTVTVGKSTRYSMSEAGSAKSLKVGECATAFGTANSIGAVTASRLAVRPGGPNGCFAGFGGFGGAPGARA